MVLDHFLECAHHQITYPTLLLLLLLLLLCFQFYHNRLEPRRLPPQSERLRPAIVDVFVPHGKKRGKINTGEAQALIDYLVHELDDSGRDENEDEDEDTVGGDHERGGTLARRGATVGIISLMGREQVRTLRKMLLENVSDAQLAKHRIVVGDASLFQGDERDVILLR